jgi:hypothetical protein
MNATISERALRSVQRRHRGSSSARRITFAAALLISVSAAVFAQPTSTGESPAWDPLAATKADDYASDLVDAARQEQLHEMERRVAALMPRPAGQDDETFRREVLKEVEGILQPYWDAMDRLAQDRVRHEANMANPPWPMNIPNARRQFAERMATQMRFQQNQIESRFRTFVAQVERFNQWQAFKQANPEEAARRTRLQLAQEAREREEVVRRQQWQVAHPARRICQPLPEYIQGATNPDQALAAIRKADPDAGYSPNASWHQTGRDSRPQERPWVTIDTTNGPVLLAKDFDVCLTWFRVAFPRG